MPKPDAAIEATTVQPEVERLISDVETLKAISDPLRLRILELMVTRARDSWSVKELAAGLDVPQTRLYHHVELLVERDLLRPAAQRVVSGIIETRYGLAALSLRLDPKLVGSGGAGESAAREMLATLLDDTRRDLDRVLATEPLGEADSSERALVSRNVIRATPARFLELKDRLRSLIEEFENEPPDPAAVTHRMFLALYADPALKEPSRE